MAISAYILKIVEKDPFLRLQMSAKEMFNHYQFFSTHKQYVKIKLIQMRQIGGVFFFSKSKILIEMIKK